MCENNIDTTVTYQPNDDESEFIVQSQDEAPYKIEPNYYSSNLLNE